MIRTVEEWKEVLQNYNCNEAARHILGDLAHYYDGRPQEKDDLIQLSNALIAYREVGHQGKESRNV